MADKPKRKNWIKSATSNSHGQFKAKAEAAGKTTREFASEHASDGGKTGQQARLAEALMGLKHKGPKKLGRLYDNPRSKAD